MRCRVDTICYVVHVADLAAKLAGAVIGSEEVPNVEDHAEAIQRLGATVEGFTTLCERVEKNVDAVIKWYA